jgi:hypothetical protein|tara:strand:+ start:489 stop:698 length:210 start_codon:yes stop_codon:yes gene_type:complete
MTTSSDLGWVLTTVGRYTAFALVDKKNHKLKKKNYYVSQGFVEVNQDSLQDATYLSHGVDCKQLLVMVE